MKTVVTVLTVAALCVCAWAADNSVVGTTPTANPQSAIRNRQSAIANRQLAIVNGIDAITIPQMLSYQGKLTDTLGSPVEDSTYSVGFRLYTAPTGGSPFWSETQSVVTRDGLFAVLLGSVTPIDSVPDAGAAYLAMSVSGGAELTPRLRIASAAYAYVSARAANADLLQGKDTTGFVRTGQAGSITSAMIVDGTIVGSDLGQMGASSGQVLKWSGSVWAPGNDSIGGGGGGDNAWVRSGSVSVLYTAHRLGVARGGAGNVLYGTYGYTQTNFGSSCTTGANGANIDNTVIGGGSGNRAWAPFTAVCGGRNNKAGDAVTDTSAIVVGGLGNRATDKFATVTGGQANIASGFGSTIAGGESDTASSSHAAVGGGYSNKASGTSTTVAGGYDGTASGNYSAVGGGMYNVASNTSATVGGGYSGTASGLRAVVGGGYNNTASGSHSVVPGGYSVSAGADYTLAFGEGLSTTTPRAVVFYHSGGATKLGVGVQNPTYNVDVAGNGRFSASGTGVNGVEAYSANAHAFFAHKPGAHCFYADTSGTSHTAFYVAKANYNGYAVEDAGQDGLWVTSADARGVYVGASGTYGVYANSDDARGGYFRNDNNSNYALTAYNNAGTGSTYKGLYVQGHGYATGGWQSYLAGGGRGYGVVSPDMEIMASGTGRLVNGQASVSLEKAFRDAVSEDVPLKVIVTPNSMCHGMCVTERSASGFSVAELTDGVSNAGFDWIAIGRLKGGEQRLDPQPTLPDVPPERDGLGAERRLAQGE